MTNEIENQILVLGDSHAVSAYKPGANISRNDGKTLYGILKEGMQNYIPEGTKHLISYFGNIDIRHHLGRQKDPLFSTIKLAEDYIKHLEELNIPKITVGIKLEKLKIEKPRAIVIDVVSTAKPALIFVRSIDFFTLLYFLNSV